VKQRQTCAQQSACALGPLRTLAQVLVVLVLSLALAAGCTLGVDADASGCPAFSNCSQHRRLS